MLFTHSSVPGTGRFCQYIPHTPPSRLYPWAEGKEAGRHFASFLASFYSSQNSNLSSLYQTPRSQNNRRVLLPSLLVDHNPSLPLYMCTWPLSRMSLHEGLAREEQKASSSFHFGFLILLPPPKQPGSVLSSLSSQPSLTRDRACMVFEYGFLPVTERYLTVMHFCRM